MKRIAVITSKIGDREPGILKEQLIKFNNVDYHAFVDEFFESETWTLHRGINFSSDLKFKDRRNAKIYKILPFLFLPDYDYYIWMDSTHDLVLNPHEIINDLNNDISVFMHPERDCIFDEFEAVRNARYDYNDLIDKQMYDYKSKGYPEKNGLYELPCFIIKNTEKVREIFLCWWEHICKYTSRDQVSFPYVLWEKKHIPQVIPGNVRVLNKYFKKTKLTTPSTII